MGDRENDVILLADAQKDLQLSEHNYFTISVFHAKRDRILSFHSQAVLSLHYFKIHHCP